MTVNHECLALSVYNQSPPHMQLEALLLPNERVKQLVEGAFSIISQGVERLDLGLQ